MSSSLKPNQDNTLYHIVIIQQTTLIPATTLPDGTVIYQPITQELLDQAPGILIDNLEAFSPSKPPTVSPIFLLITPPPAENEQTTISSEPSPVMQAALVVGLIKRLTYDHIRGA